MLNKKLVKMTSLLGALVMVGCTVPNGNLVNNNTGSNNTEKPEIDVTNLSVEMPENYTGGQLAPEEGMIPGDKETKALSQASLNVFYHTLKAEDDNKNVLISPASLSFAFGIAENGAGGETLAQMEDTVNGGIAIDDMNPLLNYLSYNLQNEDEVSWGVANSLWFNDDGTCDLEDDFLKKAVSYYDAEIYKLKFEPETADEINAWTADKTDNMIKKVLDKVNPGTRLFIVNAMCFDGEWEEQYSEDDERKDRIFINADQSESEVSLLFSTEDNYFELGEGIGFIKPYKGGEYAFVGILPDEGVTCEEYVKGLVDQNADFSEAVRNANEGDVRVYLPEFDADYDNEMSNIYKDMGMDIPFEQTEAEFKGFFTNDELSQVWIDEVIHKTHIEVDKKGTKAAAVTVIGVKEAGAIAPEFEEKPIVITLDRPFVYGIVDVETGVPIFLGCQNNMK